MEPPPPALLDELLEEVFLRLPPDEPAYLVRASLVCRSWRRILADRGFRHRYGEFHRTPLLLGFVGNVGRKPLRDALFVPTSAFRPAEADHPGWIAMDCRHGRALFAPTDYESRKTFDLVVWDPMTGDRRRVPLPDSLELRMGFNAAVLCAVEGCDHRGCPGGPCCVAVVFTELRANGAYARLYSSEAGTWSELTSVYHDHAIVNATPSVLVGDALYFSCTLRHIFKYQLDSLSLSMLQPPPMIMPSKGRLITTEDGGLGYAGICGTKLTLLSGETGARGAVGWAQRRVIDIKSLLPEGALIDPAFSWRLLTARVNGFAEGTQVIFISTSVCVYMVQLKSGRVTKVLDHDAEVFPYMSFCIPAFPAKDGASTWWRKLGWYFKCMANSKC